MNTLMADVRALFATRLYHASLAAEAGFETFNAELLDACRMLAREDTAGRAWSRQNGYSGYTSYASLDDLPRRATIFAEVKRRLDRHAAFFAKTLAFDLGARGRLVLDSLWASLLRPGGGHASHIHPHSVLSGVLYVAAPVRAGALRFEDPRLPLMMAAPPRRRDVPDADRPFVTVNPSAGDLYLWESWLRHEVTPNRSKAERISLSFNYAWREKA